nr:RNA 2',3'-cyclic phosphodiesterase [Phytoactinopolyspora alkaliphila]
MFAAIDPPGSVRDHLAAAVDAVRDDHLRWVRPESLHVTLAFYGSMPPERLSELIERLTRAARRHVPMNLRVVGSGRFGRAVLWAGVDGDTDLLRRLAASSEAAGRRAGSSQKAPARPFRPHVTVARTRTPDTDLRPYADALSEYNGPPWRATHLSLIQSHLRAGSDGRARYETVAELPFGKP